MDAGLPEGASRRLGPLAKYELRLVLVVAAVALAGIPFGLLLHQVTTDGPLTVLDESVARSLNRRIYDQDAAIAALQAISFLGKPVCLFFVVGVPCLWLLRRGAHRLVVFLVVTTVGGGIVDTIVKLAVGRPRPELDQPITTAFNHSFPSGHSMASVFSYGALLVVFGPLLGDRGRRWATIGVVALCAAIGASRLALGVHFVSDVLGGYVLGLAWLLASIAVFEVWRADRGRRRSAPLAEGVEPEETDDLVDA